MGSSEITTVEGEVLSLPIARTAKEIIAWRETVQHIMDTVMIEGVHYGEIWKGAPKSLYRAGAECLLTTFRLSAIVAEVENLDEHDIVARRAIVEVIDPTGIVLARLTGVCSSEEEKYKWRAPVYKSQEYEETEPSRRREVWKYNKKKGESTKVRQVRVEPADVANTIEQMAVKRALVATTKVAVGCSDMYSQDLEDLRGKIDFEEQNEPGYIEPKEKPTTPKQEPEKTPAQRSAGEFPPDINPLKTTIADVASKPTKGSTLWIIKDGKGQLSTTFDAMIATAAESAKTEEKNVEVVYIKDGNYTNIVGIRLL